VNISISNIVGTIALLITFLALNPLITTAQELLIQRLGPTESFMVQSISLLMLLGIVYNLFSEDASPRTV